ncbi:MAG: Maf family protein [Arenicellales bacterium]|nr:Maf family protein [Arenicellales bacterium]
MSTRLCLASQSPRRGELLRQAGFDFSVFVPEVDESAQFGESPHALVERLSISKAQAATTAMADSPSQSLVCLGADTVVVADAQVLGKPSDAAHAKEMLSGLSGRSHEVLTAITVAADLELHSRVVTSTVTFRQFSDQDIQAYCATGEPLDKAGGYAIQGFAGVFVRSLSGSYSAVMGLPLCETAGLLAAVGIWPRWQQNGNGNGNVQ